MRTPNRFLILSVASMPFPVLLLTTILVLAQISVGPKANNSTTTRVSVATGGAEANGTSFEVAVSADERYVAFTSGANNLVSDDTNGVWDVFVHDRQTSQTERVSVASSGGEGDGNSHTPDISADGRHVAFESAATTLVATDTNNVADIFVHDRQGGQTVRVSIAGSGSQSNGASGKPDISADGRFVAFESTATNLEPDDFNNAQNVFVHDRDADEDGIYDEIGQVSTVRVSLSSGGTQGNGASRAASVSADGRYVVFASSASNLVGGDNNGFQDIFVRDRDRDGDEVYDEFGQVSTTLISHSFEGTPADGQSDRPFISADGGTVVFESFATNLVPGGTAQFIQHVFAHDVQTGRTTLVSIASDGSQSNGWSQNANVSEDGRNVAFSSKADNLVTGDTNFFTDIFLHDRDVDQDGYFDEPGQVSTVRVNVASDGSLTANEHSYSPALSGDGQATAFESAASNLVANDTNFFSDIFVHDQFSLTSGADLSVTVCCNEALKDISEINYDQDSDFLISVTNKGPDTAHNVTVDLSSPTTVDTPTQGTCDPGPPGTCNFGTLAVGASASVLVTECCLPASKYLFYLGKLVTTARVSADENDPHSTDNSDAATNWWYNCDYGDCLVQLLGCRSNWDPFPLLSKLRAAADFIPHLPLYYDVRDEILATPDGQHLTNLYNTYGDEIFSLMENDQNLWDQGLYALEAWEPNLQAMVDGQGSVTITALQVQVVDDFLTNLSAAGSPELKQDITAERTRLGNPDDFVGMTIEEARGAVIGDVVFLPLIQKQ